MKALVVEKKSNIFELECEGGKPCSLARKNLKEQGIFVGDFVEYNEDLNIIEKIYPRKNLFIRPNIANLEKLFIVIAQTPKPDFKIVDKLILFSLTCDVIPIICVNKIDIADKFFLIEVEKVYKNVCPIIFLSAKTSENLEDLHSQMKGHICAFAGQSAVGKSALINKIYNANITLEGNLSKKIKRGKNTTRSAKLYKLEHNTFIADTAGFSSLSEKYLPINYFELCYYYPDFLSSHETCKYKSCTHTKESINDCGVKKGVKLGLIDQNRYERYLEIFEVLKEEFIKNHG